MLLLLEIISVVDLVQRTYCGSPSMNKLTVNQKYSFFLKAASLFGRSQRSRRKQGR